MHRKTYKSTGVGYAAFFLQFLVELKSISDMDTEIGNIIKKEAGWEEFRGTYIQHQIDQEEAKQGIGYHYHRKLSYCRR